MIKRIKLIIFSGLFAILSLQLIIFQGLFKYNANTNDKLSVTPTEISSILLAPDQIKVKWSFNSSDELGFKVERSLSYEDDFVEIARTGPNITSYIDSGIDPEKMYYYRVKAYNLAGDTDYSILTSPPKEVNYDFMAGIGDMKESTHIHGSSYFNSNDVVGPSVDDQVANGWRRHTNMATIPKINSIFRIDQEGGFNSQYMGVLGTKSNDADISISNEINVSNIDLQQGDILRFEFDYVKFSGYEDLPNGSSVQYGIRLYGQAGESTNPALNYVNMFFIQKDNIDPTSQGPLYVEGTVVRDLNIEGISYPNYPILHLYSSFRMFVDGDIGTAQPGVNFSGAHIFIKKKDQSSFQKIIVPAPHNRNVQTGLVFYSPARYNIYDVASNFDWVSTDYLFDDEVSKLKYYNPNVKVYFYMAAAAMADYRDENFNDWTNPGTEFQWALDNHPEWFYSRYRDPVNKIGDMIPLVNGEDPRKKEYKRYFNEEDYAEYLATGDESKQIPYFFDIQYPQIYSVNPSIPSYQDYYYNSVVKAQNFYNFDGVFVDTLGATGSWSVANPSQDLQKLVLPDQIQKFQENVFPRLREAGITTIQNNCSMHYSTYGYGGITALNPYWKKDSLSVENLLLENTPTIDLTTFVNNYYGGSSPIALFDDNNPDMTADFFFQERAFFGGYDRNYYSTSEWLNALTDMDLASEWNANLSDDKKKKIFQLVHGVDNAENPALGINGWAQFGLTSYLLGSSDYSWLGIDKVGSYEQIFSFYSLTSKLGDPVSRRVDLKSDTDHSLQSRRFSGGLVVVNGDSNIAQKYILSKEMLDETNSVISGEITLLPHTGRIFYDFPITTANYNQNYQSKNGFFNKEVKVNLSTSETVHDNLVTYYRIDDDVQKIYSGEIVIPEGSHTLYYWSEDTGPDSSSVEEEKSIDFKIDLTAPPVAVPKSPLYTFKNILTLKLDKNIDITQMFVNDSEIIYNSSGQYWHMDQQLNVGETKTLIIKTMDLAGNNSNSALVVTRRRIGDAVSNLQAGIDKVNIYDFSALLSFWGTNNYSTDFNGDGTTDIYDFSDMLLNWTN